MKHQNVLRILAIAFAVVMMFAIASCDLLQPEHVHTEVELAAKEATCTTSGLTAGKKCTSCGAITVAQKVVPAKGHTEEVVPAVEVTCDSIGLTEGKKCSVCDVPLVAQKVIPARGHVEGAAATCTTAQTCTVCEEELVAAKGHEWGTEVTTVTAATCVDGKGTVKCKNCDATKEVVIPASAEHKWVDPKVTTAPTCTKTGIMTYTCTCGNTVEGEIPATHEHTLDENYKCSVCEITYLITLDEAIKIGEAFPKSVTTAGKEVYYLTDDVYYVIITLDKNANANGFARGSAADGTLFSIAAYELQEGQEYPKLGDTVMFCGKIGCVNSAGNASTKEGRIFQTQLVKVVAICDHAAGFTAATCAVPETCKTCGRTRGETTDEHVWKDATCVAPKTCTVCGKTEGEAAGAHVWDAAYTKCTACGEKILSPEEAYDMGVAFGNTTSRTEEVYIKLTLDNQVNANGFARGTVVAGKSYVSVAGPYKTDYVNETIKLGDTVILKGKLGGVSSALCDIPYEARLYDVTAWEIITCEHTWGVKVFNVSSCVTVGTGIVECTTCGARKSVDMTEALGHDMVNGVCSRCGTSELNENDIAWLTAQGLDASKYLKLDLKFTESMGYFYNPASGTGKWVAENNKHEMSTREITKAEMGVGSIIRVDHLAKGDDGAWTKMIQYRPEFFVAATGKSPYTARQGALKIGGRIDVTEEWWKGVTDGRKSDKFDTVSFTLTALSVTAAGVEDKAYTTTADTSYTFTEADYDNFVIYVLK